MRARPLPLGTAGAVRYAVDGHALTLTSRLRFADGRAMRRRARATRPPLVRQRNGELRAQSFRSERLLDLAVELAFDHHVDQPGAETRAPRPFGYGAAAFLPIEHQREPLLGTRDRPRDIDVAGRFGKAAMLARVGRELVHRHA